MVRRRLGPYEVAVATGYGPRIIGLAREGGPEILASLPPSVRIEGWGGPNYVFRGGHRLWVAPEVPEITYAPDDRGCQVTVSGAGLVVTGPADAAGFAKEIEIIPDGNRLSVEHRLRAAHPAVAAASPWAITQLPLGGMAVLPLVDPHPQTGTGGLQADRALVLWPYTDLQDRRLAMRRDSVLIDAEAGPRLKVGSAPNPPRLGYLRHGYLFVKHLDLAEPGVRPDLGAAGQVYVDGRFCELESLGPLSPVPPGSEVTLRESWEVLECDRPEEAVAYVRGSS